MALISLPLALDLVPSNELYGYRTAESTSSAAAWYEFNHVAGWTGLAAVAVTLLLGNSSRLSPSTRLQIWIGTFLLAVLAVVIVPAALVS